MAELSLLGLVRESSAPALFQCWIAHGVKGRLKLCSPGPAAAAGPILPTGATSAHQQRHSNLTWMSSCATCLGRGAGLGELQRSLLSLLML